MKPITWWATGLGALTLACGDSPPEQPPEPPATAAESLLARSIAFHDPGGVWATRPVTMEWYGTSADNSERVAVEFTQYPDADRFELSGRYRGSELEYRTDATSWTATVDGADDYDDETRERMRLHREDGFFWRSYYGFLSGLPMKLRDPGTIVDPEVQETTFQGREVHGIRVTFEEEVGGDTWYFYFDPDTAELVGCRFYHDESANDGEYITFEGLTDGGGLRLPRHRSWYMNADDRFLGTDEVRRITPGEDVDPGTGQD